MDDKFRKAMLKTGHSQVDNDKQVLVYEVDLYKDMIEELEENLIRITNDYKNKCRGFDQMTRDMKKLQTECHFYKECLQQRECLIERAGLVLIDSHECNGVDALNGDINGTTSESIGDDSGSECGLSASATKTAASASAISQEAAQLLQDVEGFSLEAKIKSLLTEKQMFMNEMNAIKTELTRERERSAKLELTLIQGSNQSANCEPNLDIQREANKLISDYKFKLRKCEQEMTVLNGNVVRLETQLLRYRTAAEEAEKLEDELKADKRKTQRELREALARIEELETSNAHLQKRIDKLKSNRNIVINTTN